MRNSLTGEKKIEKKSIYRCHNRIHVVILHHATYTAIHVSSPLDSWGSKGSIWMCTSESQQ